MLGSRLPCCPRACLPLLSLVAGLSPTLAATFINHMPPPPTLVVLSRLRDRPQLRLRADKLPSPNHCESCDFLLVFNHLSLLSQSTLSSCSGQSAIFSVCLIAKYFSFSAVPFVVPVRASLL